MEARKSPSKPREEQHYRELLIEDGDMDGVGPSYQSTLDVQTSREGDNSSNGSDQTSSMINKKTDQPKEIHPWYTIDGFLAHDENLYYKGIFALTVSALLTGLGNNMVPISILSLLQTFFLLIGVDFVFRKVHLFSKHGWYTLAYIWIMHGLGFCLGFYSMFGYPKTNAATVLQSFGAGILAWLLYIILALIPHIMYLSLFPKCIYGIFVFPTLETVVACSLIGNVFSTFVAPGNTVLDYSPLKQVASLVGIAGVNYIIVFCGSFPAFLLTRKKEIGRSRLKNWLTYSVVALLLLFSVTCYINQGPYLFQRNVADLIKPTFPVSCIMGQNIEAGSSDWTTLWASTESRIVNGDGIVLMAEEAMHLKSSAEETTVINNALQLVEKSTAPKGVLLGLLYMLDIEGDSLKHNRFTLVSYAPGEGSKVVWKYDKAHPVPLIEMNIKPGKEELKFAHSNYGYLSGGICFDLDFPQYIAQAGREEVDLFLQPSWTWNAIHTRHFEDNAVRAVENGFTIFRCSSDGESGVVDPQGRIIHREYTGHDPSVVTTFSVPILDRTNPMFPFLGFIFEYICIVWGFYYMVYCGLGFKKFRNGVTFDQ